MKESLTQSGSVLVTPETSLSDERVAIATRNNEKSWLWIAEVGQMRRRYFCVSIKTNINHPSRG